MLKFLPKNVQDEIISLCGDNLCEVRIRAGEKIQVYTSENGIESVKKLPIEMSVEEIEKCFMRLCNFAYFTVEDQIKSGFITSSEGERVGICGECVLNGGEVTAIKNITSLCVRFPKNIIGCAEKFFDKYVKTSPKSCLVISPPSQGKTTFIRDLGRLYSDKLGLGVLYIDERDELSGGGKFYLGENADVLRFANKDYGFKVGVRTLNPKVIVCDELMSGDDANSVLFASASGVKVISSVHSDNLKNVLKKQEISAILKCFIFDYVIEIDRFNIRKVYNEKLEPIC